MSQEEMKVDSAGVGNVTDGVTLLPCGPDAAKSSSSSSMLSEQLASGLNGVDDDSMVDVDCFYGRLTDKMRRELGEINMNWFEDAILQSSSPKMASHNETGDLQESPIALDCLPSPNFYSPGLSQDSERSPEIRGSDGTPNDWTHSTPGDLTLSLGASMGGHELSWTSSMATPIAPSAAGMLIKENLGLSFNANPKDSIGSDSLSSARSSTWNSNNDDVTSGALQDPFKDNAEITTKDNNKSVAKCGVASLQEQSAAATSKLPPPVCAKVVIPGTPAEGQEFKKPAEKLRPAEKNNETSRTDVSSTPSPVVNDSLGNNSTQVEEVLREPDESHVEDFSATPKKPKSALKVSRVSLPRRRMADLRSDVPDSEVANKVDEEIIETTSKVIVEKPGAAAAIKNAPKPALTAESKTSKSQSNSKCGFKKDSVDDKKKEASDAAEAAAMKLRALQEEQQLRLERAIASIIPAPEPPAPSVDEEELFEDTVTIVPEERKQHQHQNPSDIQANLSRRVIGKVPADHDYAVRPSSTRGFSDCSQQLSNETQLMEIVDCTTACLESIKEDPFLVEFCPRPGAAFKSILIVKQPPQREPNNIELKEEAKCSPDPPKLRSSDDAPTSSTKYSAPPVVALSFVKSDDVADGKVFSKQTEIGDVGSEVKEDDADVWDSDFPYVEMMPPTIVPKVEFKVKSLQKQVSEFEDKVSDSKHLADFYKDQTDLSAHPTDYSNHLSDFSKEQTDFSKDSSMLTDKVSLSVDKVASSKVTTNVLMNAEENAKNALQDVAQGQGIVLAPPPGNGGLFEKAVLEVLMEGVEEEEVESCNRLLKKTVEMSAEAQQMVAHDNVAVPQGLLEDVKGASCKPELENTAKLSTVQKESKLQETALRSAEAKVVVEEVMNPTIVLASKQKAESSAVEEPRPTASSTKDQVEVRIKPTTSSMAIMPGFSLASGKSIQISKTALEEARRRHQEDLKFEGFAMPDGLKDIVPSVVTDKEKIQAFQGFSTASGKSVTVSESAMEEAKQLHKELFTDTTMTSRDDVAPKKFQGFSTASGKACKVSEDALKKGRLVLESLLDEAAETKSEKCEKSSLTKSGPGTDGRGQKRLFSSTEDQQLLCEPPNKVNLRNEDDDAEADESSSATDPPNQNQDVSNAMDVSEDSLDAAQALIAMSIAGWNEPTLGDDEEPPDAKVKKTCPGRPPDAHAKCNLDVTSNDMSAEVLESTFAFLEDELQTDVSNGDNASFDALESLSVKIKTSSKHPLAYNCSEGDASSVKKCDPSIRSLMSDTPSRRRTVVQEQLERIAKKSKLNIAPSMGPLYNAKANASHARLTMRQFFGGIPRSLPSLEALKLGVKESTLNVRSRNAEEYRFTFDDHSEMDADGFVKLEPDASLVLGDGNSAGKEEFYKALVDCAGVDPKLVSREWVFNHYRWIVWKLAAIEACFPHKCAGLCLTPARVFGELRYRVNCEIDCSRRSALKKIAERDDIPMKTMVLCVADIIRSDADTSEQCDKDASVDATKNTVHLELTDGWYSMKAIMDDPLTYLVERGEISVGQKLVVHGVELVGSSEACPPLEVQSNQFLKLNYNCCRRARWDAKLGYLLCPRPFPLPLNSFRSDGGAIGRVDVIIARVYPLQYLEKRSDGSSIVCNAKVNAMADQQADLMKCALMDRLFEDARSKLEKDDMLCARKRRFSSGSRNLNAGDLASLVSGEELAEALKNSNDPVFFESCLTGAQKASLVSYNLRAEQTKQDKLQNKLSKFMQEKQNDGEFPKDRNVISFLKVRVAGVHPMDVDEKTTSMMTLWRPSENINSLLEEGKCMRIYYLMAERRCNGRELLVKSTKMTKFEEKCDIGDDVIKHVFKPREFTPFDDILSHGFQPLYGEVDVVGVVLSVGNASQPQRGKFEFIYLVNADQEIIGVKFWGGLKAFGLEAVLEQGSFVVGCNLQWRGRERTPIPCVYMLEISSFTRNPKSERVKRLLNSLRSSIKDLNVFLEKAKEKLSDALQSSSYAPLVSSPMFRPGQPKFASTPKGGWRPPFKSDGAGASTSTCQDHQSSRSTTRTTLKTLNSSCEMSPGDDTTLRRMAQLQRYVGAPPQLGALASPWATSASAKYKVPSSNPGPASSHK